MRRIFGCAAIVAALLVSLGATGGTAGSTQNYIVLYKQQAIGSNASSTMRQAGGTLVYAYPQIGVAIASSGDASFSSNLLKNSTIESASATTGFATQLAPDGADSGGPAAGDLPNAPATDADTLSGLQWDMRQIHAPQAHAITGGSPSVLVGDIDTGIDFRHPDLQQNIDIADSVSCLGGVPVPGLAAQDDNGHGTHTAGTIAAASNGIGIVGVAPNVRIAGIKAGDANGFFFPEAVICSFIWAGTHHVDVTNNSYFADPFLFNCRNDPAQRAIWKAEQRAIRFAMNAGTTVVAAEGNESEDLAHPTMDTTSPDYPPGSAQQREITNACIVIPTELPGVIGVTADGHNTQDTSAGKYPDYLKSFYSSYGAASADVVAPGGDSLFGSNAEAPNGRVLSTWPANIPCARKVQEGTSDPTYPTAVYCYLQGTSMAAPHVAGVAALVVSKYGRSTNPKTGKMPPGQVEAIVEGTADPQACPLTLPTGYLAFTGSQSGATQSCTGGAGMNSWYGHGQADALGAVS